MVKPAPAVVALILAIVYFVWPVDLIPDLFGPVGRIDDLLVFALVAWQAYSQRRKADNEHSKDQPPRSEAARSPHEVLGVPANATKEEIEARYRQLAQQYHPDKVNHLGDELQKVAHEKMLEIAAAYRSLRA